MKTQKGISTFFALLVVGIVIIISFTVLFSYQYIWRSREEIIPFFKSETHEKEATKFYDCGIVPPLSLEDVYVSKIELPESLSCFGENLLNNCKNSKIIYRDEKGAITTVKISGRDNSDCKLRIENPDKDKMVDEKWKLLANTYCECPVSGLVNAIIDANYASAEQLEKEAAVSPGAYVYRLDFHMTLLCMTPEKARKYGCEGTFLDIWPEAQEQWLKDEL